VPSVEEKIDIPDGRKDDFRLEIMNYIDGKRFDYKTNEQMQKTVNKGAAGIILALPLGPNH
jgi:serine protein kinase